MQKLINTFKPKLSELVKKYPHIAINFNDNALAINTADIFKKLGFKVHLQEKQNSSQLVKILALWLNNNNLVLFQYKTQSSSDSLVNLLRAVKSSVPNISFKNLIPVIIVSYSSKRQMEMFRLLSAFDIQYVSFLTPNASAEKNVEEILGDLFNFNKLVKKEYPAGKKEPSHERDPYPEKIKKYNDLLLEGENLMQNANYEDAIKYFTEAITLKPDSKALVDRGDAYYKSRKYIPALYDYREASKLQQAVPEPYTKIGACCFILIRDNMKMNEPEKAKKWFALGMKHFDIAENIVDKMVNENKESPEMLAKTPYATIVSALSEVDIRGLGLDGMENQVSEYTARIIKKNPPIDFMSSEIDIDARIDQAILLTRNKNYEKAEKIFRKIIEDDLSLVGPAFNNFAVELRKNGHEGKAFEIYIELLEHEVPEKHIIIENLKTAGRNHAANLRSNFKQKEAIDIYKTILKNNPPGKEWVLCDLAMTFLEMQDQANASSRLMEAIYINPSLTDEKQFSNYADLNKIKEEMIRKLSGITMQ